MGFAFRILFFSDTFVNSVLRFIYTENVNSLGTFEVKLFEMKNSQWLNFTFSKCISQVNRTFV